MCFNRRVCCFIFPLKSFLILLKFLHMCHGFLMVFSLFVFFFLWFLDVFHLAVSGEDTGKLCSSTEISPRKGLFF